MILSQDNYFELLGIDENATEREIRLAYTKMLRIYPHEQYPEEFQLLLKAKDTLLDPELREKHIKNISNGGIYDLLVDETINHYDNGNLKLAYDTVKKLLKETNDTDSEVLKMASTITGELGNNQEQQKYIQTLESKYAHQIDVMRYLSNYYFLQKKYPKSIIYAEQVIKLDSSNLNEIIFLIDLYRLNNQYDKAKAFTKSNLNKSLQLHDYPIIEVGLIIATNSDDRAFAKELVERLKTLATGSNKYEILKFITNTMDELDENKYIFKFFISIVEEINNLEFKEYTEWINEAKRYINPRIEYFELDEKIYTRSYGSVPKAKTGDNTLNRNITYEPDASSNSEIKERSALRGSLVWAIIFGLITWFGSENLGTGVIIAIIWYFLGGLIKGLIGCFVIIVIIIALVAMIFGV